MSYLLHLISDNCSTYIVKWLRPYSIWVTESRSRFVVYPDLDSVAHWMVLFVNVVECDVIVVCLHWWCWCDVILLLSTAGFASESALKLDSWIRIRRLNGRLHWIQIQIWQIKYAIRAGAWLITPLDHISPWVVALIIHHCSLYHYPALLMLIPEMSRQQTSSPWGCCPSLELLKSTMSVGLSWSSGLLHCNGATKAIRELLYGSYAVNIYTY